MSRFPSKAFSVLALDRDVKALAAIRDGLLDRFGLSVLELRAKWLPVMDKQAVFAIRRYAGEAGRDGFVHATKCASRRRDRPHILRKVR
jgi:hypothetical protein